MTTSPASPNARRRRTSAKPRRTLSAVNVAEARRALVLQGGGALGAYQAGVYAAVVDRPEQPDWLAGVSIGAINAALIAGNPIERRVERLREFWHLVSSAPAQRLPSNEATRRWMNQWSAAAAVAAGIPGFFKPVWSPALALGGAAPLLSYYDTAPLKETLERLVDFDRINDGPIRLSVGAVNVRTGNSVYFDNTQQKIGPEHIMASGALPPGFPPVHIDGEDYWDGGIVSNTPLQYVLDNHPRDQALVVLQVDLFSARGELPRTLADVAQRQKDIVYSSRTRMNTDVLAGNANLEQAIVELIDQLPPGLRNSAHVATLCAHLRRQPIDILHLIYRHKPYELDSKDYEFSRAAVTEHWEAGVRDIERTLAHPDWRGSVSEGGITTFDLTEPDAPRVRHPASALARGLRQRA